MSERARLLRTGLPAGAVSSTESTELDDGWTLLSTEPGRCAGPADVPLDAASLPATVPGTVAGAAGPPGLDGHEPYHASDWWYRRSLTGPGGDGPVRLRFDGLATLAEVWLNGELVLESTNMFCAHEVDVTDLLEDDNDLAVAFRSIDAALARRRPRPRWKTRLTDHQQLRWLRTTLLGRIPGWCPTIQPVGPWRSVWLERPVGLDVVELQLLPKVGDGPTISLAASIEAVGATRLRRATLRVAGSEIEVELAEAEGGWTLRGGGDVPGASLWWPATHGEPALHGCSLELETSTGPVTVDCGRVGFRDVALDDSDGRIHFVVNGTRVFCRGSCWTSNDVVTLVGAPDRLRETLAATAAAHANMIRVGGTMVYESDDFYRACDELGLMVWQDFMFANMDYPIDDEGFAASIEGEARQQLTRLQRHPSVVAFCGGSEVEQQAAMFGAAPEIWTNDFFSGTLPALVGEHAPGSPYWTSTPTGGALPFHVGEGLTHYYGVGAYLRPLADVRLAGVRFTPECLGFSNVPEAPNLAKLTVKGAVHPHDPAWKAGVPRDSGAGWDFEDVRDHYLARLYDVEPVALRSHDPDRYLALSRIVTGEVMERTFDEWRSEEDGCGGALTWFLRDLRPGAGWGVIDSDGRPKAAYHHLKRAWAPRCVRLLDRGLDGLVAIVFNEEPEPLAATLELFALTRGSVRVAESTTDLTVAARGTAGVPVEAAFGHFFDSTYSYRFGPPRHEAIAARLVGATDGRLVSEDVYRPVRARMTGAAALDVTVAERPEGRLTITLESDTLLYDVRIDVRDHLPAENHFCLTPGRPRTVEARRVSDSGKSFQGYVDALNLDDPVRLELATD